MDEGIKKLIIKTYEEVSKDIETLEFKEPTNTIAFYNNAASHRTYIHSISITYLVK